MSGLEYPLTVKEGDPVPHDIVPCNVLPPLVWKNEIPEPVDWKKLIGPSFILAAMGLGSGEAVMWPYMAAYYGFGVFWAAVIGCITQYFLNMEIERWTLATGESVLTGFIRTGRVWGPVYIACTLIPYFWPGWATGAGQVVNWFVGGNVTMWAIIGLLACGAALTLGPVVYNTMEKVQTFLVLLIVFVVVLGTILTFNASSWAAFAQGAVSFGYMPEGIDMAFILGAIAYAGVGGAGNLAQSSFIRDRGYAMGKYIGRVVSPITGKPEEFRATGYLFPMTEENVDRYKKWFSAANMEQFWVFFVISLATIVLVSMFAYNTVYGADFVANTMDFIYQEGFVFEAMIGSWFRILFWIMIGACLFSTELGVLEMSARLTSEIIYTQWLRDNPAWRLDKVFFLVLWFVIACGVLILGLGLNQPLILLVIGAALNGIVMFLYSAHLLWLNTRVLPRPLGPGLVRFLILCWAIAFFGYFSLKLIADLPAKLGIV
ncbi:MAG: Nramp family divalent metal transporter [Bacillota bacterium]